MLPTELFLGGETKGRNTEGLFFQMAVETSAYFSNVQPLN